MHKGLSDGKVRLISLQFNVSNAYPIPGCIKPKKQNDAPEKFLVRKSAIKGEQFIAPEESISGLYILADLLQEGYQLVEAISMVRDKNGLPYKTIRFSFVAEQYVNQLAEEFLHDLPEIASVLTSILKTSLWRVRAFLNPFYREGEAINGQYAISVNLDARKPIIDERGNPVREWQRNKTGQKMGDKPVPIEPKRFIRVFNNDLRIV